MNSFGTLFRVSLFGESHGEVVGVLIDGCPHGIPLQPSDFTDDIKYTCNVWLGNLEDKKFFS